MSKHKKIQAAGNANANDGPGVKQLDELLAGRPAPVGKLGYGRLITTVDSMAEIKRKLAEGFEILWCQMSKIIPSERTGENK